MIFDNPGHQLALLLTVGPALEVLGEENPAAHDVSLVTAGPEGVAHPATHEDFPVISVVGDAALVPAGVAVTGIILASQTNGDVTTAARVNNFLTFSRIKIRLASGLEPGFLPISK